jgi:hypothetical protein
MNRPGSGVHARGGSHALASRLTVDSRTRIETRTVTGIFDSYNDAEAAEFNLEAAGILPTKSRWLRTTATSVATTKAMPPRALVPARA